MNTVTLIGKPGKRDRAAFVTIDGAELDDIRVRFSAKQDTAKWRCEACGRSPLPVCVHAHLMAVALANETRTTNPTRRTR